MFPEEIDVLRKRIDILQELSRRLSECNKMLEYSMKAMQNIEKSNVVEICKLQEQNDKLIACLKRAYAIVHDNCPPALNMYDECTDENCLYCQKRFIAHG